jgi:hypothetical protein
VSGASNATLVESSIDIFLWEIPLNSHFADAAQAEPQAVSHSSSAALRPPSSRWEPELSASHRAGRIEPRKRLISGLSWVSAFAGSIGAASDCYVSSPRWTV